MDFNAVMARTGDGTRFKEKYQTGEDYIMVRKDQCTAEEMQEFLKFFDAFEKDNDHQNELKLVIFGGEDIVVPETAADHIIVPVGADEQDLYDAYAGAQVLVLPSAADNTDDVMESILMKRPVLIMSDAKASRNIVDDSRCGFYYGHYYQFEGQMNYIMAWPKILVSMGINGRSYAIRKLGL